MQLSGLVEVRVEPVGDPYNGCADELFAWSWLNRHPFDWRGSNEMHFNPAGSSGPLPVTTCPRCLVAKVPKVDCGPLAIPKRLAYLTPVPGWTGIVDMPFQRAEPYEALHANSVFHPGQDIPHDNVVEHDGWGFENRHPTGGQALHKYCLYSPMVLRESIVESGGGLSPWGAGRLWGAATVFPCDYDDFPYGVFYPTSFSAWETTYWHIRWFYQGADLYNATLSLNSAVYLSVSSQHIEMVRLISALYSLEVLAVEGVTEPEAYRLFNAAIADKSDGFTLELEGATGSIEPDHICAHPLTGGPYAVAFPTSIQLGAA